MGAVVGSKTLPREAAHESVIEDEVAIGHQFWPPDYDQYLFSQFQHCTQDYLQIPC